MGLRCKLGQKLEAGNQMTSEIMRKGALRIVVHNALMCFQEKSRTRSMRTTEDK